MQSLNCDKTQEDTGLLTWRSEIFRSRLMNTFHLLQLLSGDEVRVETPNILTTDITDEQKLKTIMVKTPNDLVRFYIKNSKPRLLSRRENKMRFLNNRAGRILLFDIWANYVVTNPYFQMFVLITIIVDSIILGIEAELSGLDLKRGWQVALEAYDYLAAATFVSEIVLKWIDNFPEYWNDRWNVFDFTVTLVSLTPDVLSFLAKHPLLWFQGVPRPVSGNLRVFRVFRALKLIVYMEKVRLVVLAVAKASYEMVFITLLLFIFAYMLAIVSVIFYENPHRIGPFSSIPGAMITLFQLFTFDHWLHIYKDVVSTSGQLFALCIVLVWVVTGSFIFRNTIVGIMVTNFQTLRQEVFHASEERHKRERRTLAMLQFAEELDRQNEKRDGERDRSRKMSVFLLTGDISDDNRSSDSQLRDSQSGSDLDHGQSANSSGSEVRRPSEDQLTETMEGHIERTGREREEWQAIVEDNLDNLAKEEGSFCWPRDSLFRYYLILEALQENLAERREIIALANEFIASIHDT